MRRLLTLVAAFLLLLGARTASASSCGSDSDCAGYGKCSGGKCGACGSDSDCNGYGKCSSGRCGACGSDSDCRVGKCSNGHCGSCGSDSDCNGNGKCSNGRCGACGSDSDCSIGKCSSGHCGSCGSDSDCKGGRCSSGRCSNALSSEPTPPSLTCELDAPPVPDLLVAVATTLAEAARRPLGVLATLRAAGTGSASRSAARRSP